MINVEQPNPKTLIVNDREVEFSQRIREFISLPDRVVILLRTDGFEYGDKLVGRNLLAYDLEGEKLWRVEDHRMTLGARREDTVTRPDETGRRRVPQSISSIGLDKVNGTIVANIPHLELTIDPSNGKIIDWEQRR